MPLDPNRLNPMPGDPGYFTRAAVVRYLQEITAITGTTNEEEIVIAGMVALCGFSEASGHDMPGVVKRLLEFLSEDARQRRQG